MRARQALGAFAIAVTISVAPVGAIWAESDNTSDTVSDGTGPDPTGQPATNDQAGSEPTTTEAPVGEPDEGGSPAPGGDQSPAQPSDGAPVDAGSTETTTQHVEIESVQIGIADTGNNTSASVTPGGTSSGSPSTAVDTGTATAIGSADSTTISQKVVAEIDDTSTLDVVQISIVFNIGAAVANSGNNVATTGAGSGGSGSIATGSALAVGNQSATYLTQGAAATAGSAETDIVHQRTATLRIGLAIANSGANQITSLSTGNSATTGTGDALAIGNVADTGVTQRVDASGRDGAVIHVGQRATIINLGLAFADTGSNQIGRQLAAALTSADEAAIEQLLMLIVPELITSAERPAAAGTISTGNAAAIGNRSSTEVLQTAVADATSGDVRIDQEVLVVNGGAAVATSGQNSIGAVEDTATSLRSPEAAAVVAQLSEFLRSFLADVDSWVSGFDVVSPTRALTTRLGGFDIGIDHALTAGRGESARISTRQLAAVVNLAIARANSGGNDASIAVEHGGPTATAAPPEVARALEHAGVGTLVLVTDGAELVVVTGPATSVNAGVVVVCQRSNMAELDCLAPPVPPDPDPPIDEPNPEPTDPGSPAPSDQDPPAAAGPAVDGGHGVAAAPDLGAAEHPGSGAMLPATGSDPRGLMVAALLFVVIGAGMIVVAKQWA